MRWTSKGVNSREAFPNKDAVKESRVQLVREIRQAQSDWFAAQSRLDFVIEKDEIDYAIYLVGAAEKRYEMLLKEAKRENISVMNHITGKAMEL